MHMDRLLPARLAEPVSDTVPMADAESVPDAESVSDTEPVPNTVPMAHAEPVSDTESVSDTVPMADAESVSDTVPMANAEPMSDTVPMADAEPMSDTVPMADAGFRGLGAHFVSRLCDEQWHEFLRWVEFRHAISVEEDGRVTQNSPHLRRGREPVLWFAAASGYPRWLSPSTETHGERADSGAHRVPRVQPTATGAFELEKRTHFA